MDIYSASSLLAQYGAPAPRAELAWGRLFIPIAILGVLILIFRSKTRWYGVAAVAILLLMTMLFYVRLAAPVAYQQPPYRSSMPAPTPPVRVAPEFRLQGNDQRVQYTPVAPRPMDERPAGLNEVSPNPWTTVCTVIRAPDPDNMPLPSVPPVLAEAPIVTQPSFAQTPAAPSASTPPASTPPASKPPANNVAGDPRRNSGRNSPRNTAAKPANPALNPPASASANAPNIPTPNAGGGARPEWVNSTGGRQLNGEYILVVQSTGPTVDFCWQNIYSYQLRSAVQTYINANLNGHGWWLSSVPPDLAQMIIVDQYVEQPFPYGNANLFVKVAFSRAARERLEAMRVDSLISYRITFTAVAGALLVGFVGVVFGYLKFDALTLGQHRVKLQVLSGVLLCGLITCALVAFAIFVDTEHWHGGTNMF